MFFLKLITYDKIYIAEYSWGALSRFSSKKRPENFCKYSNESGSNCVFKMNGLCEVIPLKAQSVHCSQKIVRTHKFLKSNIISQTGWSLWKQLPRSSQSFCKKKSFQWTAMNCKKNWRKKVHFHFNVLLISFCFVY